jgi:hypothetical protein
MISDHHDGVRMEEILLCVYGLEQEEEIEGE